MGIPTDMYWQNERIIKIYGAVSAPTVMKKKVRSATDWAQAGGATRQIRPYYGEFLGKVIIEDPAPAGGGPPGSIWEASRYVALPMNG
eukprot:5983031-Amphidinium_carterae.1